MSILVYKSKALTCTKEDLIKIRSGYPDNIGLSYAKDGKLFIKKNIKDVDIFWDIIKELQNCACLIHFTKKPIINDKGYCGPYRLDEHHVMGHTGNVWLDNHLPTPGLSQSLNLLMEIKGMWHPEYLKQEYLSYLFEKGLPSGNRMVIMDSNGILYKFNDYSVSNTFHGMWTSTFVNDYISPALFKSANNITSTHLKSMTAEETYLRTYGQFCSLCKKPSHSPALIRKIDYAWVCYKCCADDSDKKIDDNIVPFVNSNKQTNIQKETSILSELESNPATRFLDVFEVVG